MERGSAVRRSWILLPGAVGDHAGLETDQAARDLERGVRRVTLGTTGRVHAVRRPGTEIQAHERAGDTGREVGRDRILADASGGDRRGPSSARLGSRGWRFLPGLLRRALPGIRGFPRRQRIRGRGPGCGRRRGRGRGRRRRRGPLRRLLRRARHDPIRTGLALRAALEQAEGHAAHHEDHRRRGHPRRGTRPRPPADQRTARRGPAGRLDQLPATPGKAGIGEPPGDRPGAGERRELRFTFRACRDVPLHLAPQPGIELAVGQVEQQLARLLVGHATSCSARRSASSA